MSQRVPTIREEILRLEEEIKLNNRMYLDCLAHVKEAHNYVLKNVCSIEHLEDSRFNEVDERLKVLEGIIIKNHSKTRWQRFIDWLL